MKDWAELRAFATLCWEHGITLDLSGANLFGANLSDAKLSGANLSYANLSYVDLSYADLSSANLYDANLFGAKLCGAKLSGANLSYANLSYADLSYADLSGVSLSYADLSDADLSSANLYDANLSSANLCRTNLSGATGLFDPCAWIEQNLKTSETGIVVYKCIGETLHRPPPHWTIEAGQYLTETVNPDVWTDCGSGVNCGTGEWCENHYPDAELWECLIEWRDAPGIVVPVDTDGKCRCSRLKLVRKMEK